MFELKRKPRALSFSSLGLYKKDKDEFFMRYLARVKAPRLPQENYMSIGSGFDAYAKNRLHVALFGEGYDAQFDFDTIFESQVEPHNRDWARAEGKYVFDCYVQSGAYQELLDLLLESIEPPRFEFSVDGMVNGVPASGKPDCRFVIKRDDRVHVILDWKVKGYCSKYGASPSKNYRLCRDSFGLPHKPSRSHNKSHNGYEPVMHRGFEVNTSPMESANVEYADQLSLYGWLLGETPGDENVVLLIDEITGKYMGPGVRPLLRVANHRARVRRDHQLKFLGELTECWETIESGHIFKDRSRQESDDHCELLDNAAVGLATNGSGEEDWFNEAVRPQFKR